MRPKQDKSPKASQRLSKDINQLSKGYHKQSQAWICLSLENIKHFPKKRPILVRPFSSNKISRNLQQWAILPYQNSVTLSKSGTRKKKQKQNIVIKKHIIYIYNTRAGLPAIIEPLHHCAQWRGRQRRHGRCSCSGRSCFVVELHGQSCGKGGLRGGKVIFRWFFCGFYWLH